MDSVGVNSTSGQSWGQTSLAILIRGSYSSDVVVIIKGSAGLPHLSLGRPARHPTRLICSCCDHDQCGIIGVVVG